MDCASAAGAVGWASNETGFFFATAKKQFDSLPAPGKIASS